MEITELEKLALVKTIDEFIKADNYVADDEMDYLSQLMETLNFDIDFVRQAREFDVHYAVLILKTLSKQKKDMLVIILNEMMNSDGEKDPREVEFLKNIINLIY